MAAAANLYHLAEFCHAAGYAHTERLREAIGQVLREFDTLELKGITTEHGFPIDAFTRTRRRVGKAFAGIKPKPREPKPEEPSNGEEKKQRRRA